MLTATPPPSDQPDVASDAEVMLADGSWFPLDGLSRDELHALQWQQEQKFARAICTMPKGSNDRALVTGQAYDTICAILAAQQQDNQPLVMGLDQRYVRLVLELLQQQINGGIGQPRLFEVGYGSGAMLKEVRDHGFQIAGLEVSRTMRDAALERLGEKYTDRLLVGDLRKVDKDSLPGKPSLIYWNDVFEHIPPDEIEEYLAHLHKLLQRGGQLVTITPNWLMRPSDVTGDFCPPRTEACGLHLKEYRLAEVTRLLKRAGFRRVATPLLVTRNRIVRFGGGFRLLKQLCEPLLEKFPVGAADLFCRGMGMSCTIATKA